MNSKTLTLFVALVIGGVFGTFVSCDSGPEPLRIGMDLTYPPFEFKDKNGNPDGVSVKMAEALGKHLGREVKIESMPFEGLMIGLTSGKIDLVISSMTATEKRRKTIDFSNHYVTTELAILVGKDSSIKGIGDLKSGTPKVVARRGTTGESYAQEHLNNAEIISLTADAACALEVAQGKADAWIYDQLSIWEHHKSHPETTKALLDSFQKEQWAIGVNKGNTSLLDEVNDFLTKFKSEGKFDELADQYLSKQKALHAEMGTPFLFD